MGEQRYFIAKLINPGYSNFIDAHDALIRVDKDFMAREIPFHPFLSQEHQLVFRQWFTEGRVQQLLEHGLDLKMLLQCLEN